MKVLSINVSNYGSTGNIMLNISKEIRKRGFRSVVCYANSKSNRKKYVKGDILIGNRIERFLSSFLERITGSIGLFNYFGTLSFLKRIKKYSPDIIHLHNIHGSFINFRLLFNFIKKHNTRIVWTLHDCWTFTGRCPYFDLTKCSLWQSGCSKCLYPKNSYPETKRCDTGKMWLKKRESFLGVKSLVLVTPSLWLAKLVSKSFLKNYRTIVINNGIDLSVFKPNIECVECLANIPLTKHIVLGVASIWEERKGIDDFLELAKLLPKNYIVVLIGTVCREKRVNYPNVIYVDNVKNQNELAKFYTRADVFVNTTREDNFPTVNIESLACGTPVITYDTGGSPEIIDCNSGRVVSCGDIASLREEVIGICEKGLELTNFCLERSKEFSSHKKYAEYVDLYLSLLMEDY